MILFGWKKSSRGNFLLVDDKDISHVVVSILENKNKCRVYISWKYHSLADPVYDTLEQAVDVVLKEVKEKGYKILPLEYMVLK